MDVHPGGAPLFPGLARKVELFTPNAPVGVVVESCLCFRPVSRQQRAMIPVNQVTSERKAQVVFDSRALDLRIAAEGKDVVPNDVVGSVMLVKPAVSRA